MRAFDRHPGPARAAGRPRHLAALLALALVASACTAAPGSVDGSGVQAAGARAPRATATPAAPAAIATPSPTQPAAASLYVSLTSVRGGFSRPVAIANGRDGSGRLYVVEQAGRIRIITRTGTLLSTPFLDIRSRVLCCGERGLLGLAFHPSYKTNGRFYVSYTDATGALVVAEYRRSTSNSNRASTTERRLMRIGHPGNANHNGGQLAFGRDGYLWIGTGDGGGSGDPGENSQDRRSPLGKLLRISPNVTSSSPAYRIPSTNPWATSTTYRREIWAYGLRNPWRFSFDRSTGDLWIGDVGQDRYEEVDRALRASGTGKGANYGWDVIEGDACFEPSSGCSTAGTTAPIAVYAHGDDGCSITGGYVYRGSRSPALRGLYLFADYCSGRIFRLDADGPARQASVLLRDTSLSISAFGEDEAGEVYVADIARGGVYRVTGR